jgi:outer membrane protein TolC
VTVFEARLAAREADVEATRREIDRRLAVLSAERRAAADRLAAADRASAANQENVAAARAQFRIARRSLIELLDVEREALGAERLRIDAERDRAVLDYAALAATGDILDLFGIRAPPAGLTALSEQGK